MCVSCVNFQKSEIESPDNKSHGSVHPNCSRPSLLRHQMIVAIPHAHRHTITLKHALTRARTHSHTHSLSLTHAHFNILQLAVGLKAADGEWKLSHTTRESLAMLMEKGPLCHAILSVLSHSSCTNNDRTFDCVILVEEQFI